MGIFLSLVEPKKYEIVVRKYSDRVNPVATFSADKDVDSGGGEIIAKFSSLISDKKGEAKLREKAKKNLQQRGFIAVTNLY